MAYNYFVVFMLIIYSVYAQNTRDRSDNSTHVLGSGEHQDPVYFATKKITKLSVKPIRYMAAFHCEAIGDPVHNITWYKNDDTVIESAGNLEYSKWRLQLDDITIKDVGNYTCEMCNNLKCTNLTHYLDVIDGSDDMAHDLETERQEKPPQFLSKKKIKFHTRPTGRAISFQCKASGYPEPNITWYKNDDKPIIRSVGNVTYGKWSLQLEHLTLEDGGNYTCKVCNHLLCIHYTYLVDVIETYTSVPIIVEKPNNITVPIAGSANFTCKFIFGIDPVVLWVRNKGPDGAIVKEGKQDMGFLEFKNVTREEEGWYTCVVRNVLGGTNSSAYLKVVHSEDENVL